MSRYEAVARDWAMRDGVCVAYAASATPVSTSASPQIAIVTPKFGSASYRRLMTIGK